MPRKKKPRRAQAPPPRGWPRYAALGTALALAAGVLLFLSRPSGDEAKREREPVRPAGRPNVLYISIDTLRADYLGAYGGAEAATPAMDGLAADGVLFENAVSHVALTLPSHASVFTSRIPPHHGVRDNATFRLDPAQTSLAEVLKAAGYRTAAFVGAFVLDARFGLDQGFDRYDDDLGESDEPERRAGAVLSAATQWLDGQPRTERWFAFVHLFDAHAPYEAPAPFGEEHRDNPYAGEVAYVDHALGEFLDHLRAAGQLDDTLVVLASDHGEGLGEHGERTHGMFAYNSTLHVPLLMRWPAALPSGARVAERVRLIDVAPTILELAGLAVPDSFEGRSTVSLVAGRDPEGDRNSYFEALTYSFNRGSAPLFGLYEGDFKLVSLPIPELYDVKSDPDELENLAPERAAKMRQMAGVLSGLVRSEVEDESSRIPTDEVDTDALEKMHALGYIVAPRRLPGLTAEYGPADDPKHWIHLANKLDDAVNLHRAGKLDEASRLLREILAERPTVATAAARLARVLDDQGRPDRALAVLETAFDQGVDAPEIVLLLGRHLSAAGQEARWIEVLERVVQQRPEDADAREALASALGRAGRHAEAARELERLAALRPQDAGAALELGIARLQAGRLEDAESPLRRAVAQDPSLGPAWSALGDVSAARGREAEAIEAWRRAAETEGAPVDTLVRLGIALADEGRVDEALVYLERFSSTAPPETYGDELRQVGDFIEILKREAGGGR